MVVVVVEVVQDVGLGAALGVGSDVGLVEVDVVAVWMNAVGCCGAEDVAVVKDGGSYCCCAAAVENDGNCYVVGDGVNCFAVADDVSCYAAVGGGSRSAVGGS